MDNETLAKAKAIHAALPSVQQAAHTKAWEDIENLVISLQPKKAKVFEVQHAITHARKLYLTEVATGFCAFDCARIVRAAYATT